MVTAVGAVGASGAAGGNSAMEVLQRKMGDLMKQLREATQDRSPGAEKRMKLLQIQIQAVQAQIEALQTAAAQKAALEQLKHQQELAAAAAQKAKASNDTVGSVIDTTA